MTCRELTSFIADYLSGELETDTRQTFERHLSLCPNCVQYVADYQRAVALGQRVFSDEADPAANVPEGLVTAILAARRGRLTPE
jgi:anti-sigma factor RsiW